MTFVQSVYLDFTECPKFASIRSLMPVSFVAQNGLSSELSYPAVPTSPFN